MDFKFSEEEEIFRKSVREFCQRHIAPKWVEMDEKGEISVDLIKAMAKQGMIGTLISPDYGGPGGSAVMATVAIEEVAYHDPSLATAVYLLLHNSWPYIFQVYGEEEAKEEILPRITRGEAAFGIASTEAQGGSDVAGIRTLTARRRDAKTWVVNGEKTIVSGSSAVERLPWGGGWFLVARTGPVEERHRSITNFAFLARRGGDRVPGCEYEVFEEIGRHGIKTGTITFKDAEVEDKYRIGEENRGFRIAMQGFNLARCLVGIASIGCAKWALDQAVEWVRERKLWGKPISAFQGVSFKFAELYAEVEAARLLCYRAAWLADRYYLEKDPSVSMRDIAIAAACAKMKAPEAAMRVCEEVMKWHGGMAYFKELPLYRAW
ncbi:MAG: acyl-CoA dehydrogenase family protein, partial [Candidatus Geothermarchaeales archaeon]